MLVVVTSEHQVWWTRKKVDNFLRISSLLSLSFFFIFFRFFPQQFNSTRKINKNVVIEIYIQFQYMYRKRVWVKVSERSECCCSVLCNMNEVSYKKNKSFNRISKADWSFFFCFSFDVDVTCWEIFFFSLRCCYIWLVFHFHFHTHSRDLQQWTFFFIIFSHAVSVCECLSTFSIGIFHPLLKYRTINLIFVCVCMWKTRWKSSPTRNTQ
jgi:hypothetical protein